MNTEPAHPWQEADDFRRGVEERPEYERTYLEQFSPPLYASNEPVLPPIDEYREAARRRLSESRHYFDPLAIEEAIA